MAMRSARAENPLFAAPIRGGGTSSVTGPAIRNTKLLTGDAALLLGQNELEVDDPNAPADAKKKADAAPAAATSIQSAFANVAKASANTMNPALAAMMGGGGALGGALSGAAGAAGQVAEAAKKAWSGGGAQGCPPGGCTTPGGGGFPQGGPIVPGVNSGNIGDPAKAVQFGKEYEYLTTGMKPNDKKIVVYGADGCGPCKQLMSDLGLKPETDAKGMETGKYTGTTKDGIPVEYYRADIVNNEGNKIHAAAAANHQNVNSFPTMFLVQAGANGQVQGWNAGTASSQSVEALSAGIKNGNVKLPEAVKPEITRKPENEVVANAIRTATEGSVKGVLSSDDKKTPEGIDKAQTRHFVDIGKKEDATSKEGLLSFMHRYASDLAEGKGLKGPDGKPLNAEQWKQLVADIKTHGDLRDSDGKISPDVPSATNIEQIRKLAAASHELEWSGGGSAPLHLPGADDHKDSLAHIAAAGNSKTAADHLTEMLVAATGPCANGVCSGDKPGSQIRMFAGMNASQIADLATQNGWKGDRNEAMQAFGAASKQEPKDSTRTEVEILAEAANKNLKSHEELLKKE